MRRRTQLFLGATFFALLLVYGGVRFVRTFSLLGMESDPGWTAHQVGNLVLIGQLSLVQPEGPLRLGDELVAINGDTIEYASEVPPIFHHIEPGEPYTVQVKRNGFLLPPLYLQSQAIPLRSWIVNGVVRLVIPNIFLLTGLAVFLLKPDDKKALLLALMFGMFNGAILAIDPSFAGEPLSLLAVMLSVNLVSVFLWPVFLHFFQIFPEPSALLRRSPRLEAWLYAPHLLTIFPYFAILNLLAAFAPERSIYFRVNYQLFGSVSIVVATLYIGGGLLSLLVNYRQAGRASRRRMRVVVAGSIAGFLPMFLAILLSVAFNLPMTNPKLAQWLVIAALFSFPLFPLSFAYAIVRHQVIPVRLILRRSVRYVLVSRGFIIIQALVVFAVLSFLLTGSRLEAIDELGDRADIIVTMAATAMAIGVLTLLNQRVMPIIDRRFFREAYDAHQILSDLGMEMRSVTTVRQMLELAVAKIQDALHVESINIFLRDRASGEYPCSISSSLEATGVSAADFDSSLLLPADGYAAKRLRRSSLPLTVDLTTWGQGIPTSDSAIVELHHQERDMLRRIRSSLLLPIATKDELLGIISLGPRLGDLPFSREDKQLLMAVALQMAFAIKNVELVQLVAAEERLRHELELATTVQRRLFPECPPDSASLDLWGVCHPAHGVGGDYYDFIQLDDRKLGIAVADVAGKGISAALLMSTVQASLRSRAQSVNGNLIELVSSMNELLHFSTDAASYATFFYAQFDEVTRLLTYVNAGHNPPILVHASSPLKAQRAGSAGGVGRDTFAVEEETQVEAFERRVRLLTSGGPIIGAFSDCKYEQETIQMERGDVLVAYTDGVTEAFNSDEEQFGESRLRGIIANSAHMSATELSEEIVERVRGWCGVTAQQDDLTLVIMKVK
ncbi:MAG TPA: SpoIIE family protein phosphatase [Blastocatellia bacterium]|nr:SpoIIE family protein phosphatase [Blastocatellia bacterium]